MFSGVRISGDSASMPQYSIGFVTDNIGSIPVDGYLCFNLSCNTGCVRNGATFPKACVEIKVISCNEKKISCSSTVMNSYYKTYSHNPIELNPTGGECIRPRDYGISAQLEEVGAVIVGATSEVGAKFKIEATVDSTATESETLTVTRRILPDSLFIRLSIDSCPYGENSKDLKHLCVDDVFIYYFQIIRKDGRDWNPRGGGIPLRITENPLNGSKKALESFGYEDDGCGYPTNKYNDDSINYFGWFYPSRTEVAFKISKDSTLIGYKGIIEFFIDSAYAYSDTLCITCPDLGIIRTNAFVKYTSLSPTKAITVYNILGQTVYRNGGINLHIKQLNSILSKNPNGIYLIKFTTNKNEIIVSTTNMSNGFHEFIEKRIVSKSTGHY